MRTPRDKALIARLQEGLPLVEAPYAAVAADVGMSESEVLARLREWRRAGVLRRVCAYIRHRNAGYVANGMAVWDAPEEGLEEAGGRIATSVMVSHCYARRRTERFPYRLYAMVHGQSREQVHAEVERLTVDCGLPPARVLFSTRELKRSTPKLFHADRP